LGNVNWAGLSITTAVICSKDLLIHLFQVVFSTWHLKYIAHQIGFHFPKNQDENKKQLNTFGTIEHRKLMVGRNIPKRKWKMNFPFKMVPFQGIFV